MNNCDAEYNFRKDGELTFIMKYFGDFKNNRIQSLIHMFFIMFLGTFVNLQ